MPISERQKEKQRKRYEERKASGLCMYCSYPAEKGHIRCSIHREIVADYVAGRRDIWKVKDLCGRCGKMPSKDGAICESCKEKRKSYKQSN